MALPIFSEPACEDTGRGELAGENHLIICRFIPGNAAIQDFPRRIVSVFYNKIAECGQAWGYFCALPEPDSL